MTTLREVKKLVAPLLARHPDLALAERGIFLRPVHHFARFIYVSATSSANQFMLGWAATAMFYPPTFVNVTQGETLGRKGRLWLLDEPDVEDELVSNIENRALPKLRAMKTLRDYAGHALPKDPVQRSYLGRLDLRFRLAFGELDEAARLLSEEICAPDRTILDRESEGLSERVKEVGAGISAGDREAIARVLHRLEARMAASLKLEKIWEPTPFPLELAR
ncbi:hypothetical protein [Terrarubrum flagellatum]|uniref:hypothetical protein n=1 Tax=Terrirubrum flagellatum TaxID=2895980 RepID=UPI0031454FC2